MRALYNSGSKNVNNLKRQNFSALCKCLLVVMSGYYLESNSSDWSVTKIKIKKWMTLSDESTRKIVYTTWAKIWEPRTARHAGISNFCPCGVIYYFGYFWNIVSNKPEIPKISNRAEIEAWCMYQDPMFSKGQELYQDFVYHVFARPRATHSLYYSISCIVCWLSWCYLLKKMLKFDKYLNNNRFQTNSLIRHFTIQKIAEHM